MKELVVIAVLMMDGVPRPYLFAAPDTASCIKDVIELKREMDKQHPDKNARWACIPVTDEKLLNFIVELK